MKTWWLVLISLSSKDSATTGFGNSGYTIPSIPNSSRCVLLGVPRSGLGENRTFAGRYPECAYYPAMQLAVS